MQRWVVRFFEAGIDVLIEKPIAADLNDAERLIAIAEANRRILQVGHLERFNPGSSGRAAESYAPAIFRDSPDEYVQPAKPRCRRGA